MRRLVAALVVATWALLPVAAGAQDDGGETTTTTEAPTTTTTTEVDPMQPAPVEPEATKAAVVLAILTAGALFGRAITSDT